MPLVVVVAVFVDFLNSMIMKNFFNTTLIRCSWPVGEGEGK